MLDRINEGSLRATPEVVSLVLDTSQAIEALMNDDTSEQGGHAGIVAALRPRYQAILGETLLLPSAAEVAAAVSQPSAQRAATRVALSDDEAADEPRAAERADTDLSVRLPLRRLDELLNLFGDIIVNRGVVEERASRLIRMITDIAGVSERLREVDQQVSGKFETAFLPSHRGMPGQPLLPGQMPPASGQRLPGYAPLPHGAPQPEFDSLEMDRYNDFHLMARSLAECVADATSLSTEMESVMRDVEANLVRENRLSSRFQDALLKVRLVPLSSLAPRLVRAVRAVAVKYGKEFELVLEGEDIEIDRGVYEDISAPLLHLVRNAIFHGIESPAERLATGKPAIGQITLSARYEGNQLIVVVRDDGRGINPRTIHDMAQARGMIDAFTTLNEHEIINLIFQPGFSTSESVTEEAGRGVGLDVVRDTVERLRGTVAVSSVPGQDAEFTLTVPISLQIQHVVLVRARRPDVRDLDEHRRADRPVGLLQPQPDQPRARAGSARRAVRAGASFQLPATALAAGQ